MNPAPSFRLIDHGWRKEFESAGKLGPDELLIVSPFIKQSAARALIKGAKRARVLTRFSLREFAEGVSDIAALRDFLDAGVEVRGIRNLHAKMYVFGALRAIVTSANLTDAALSRNHELGFVAEDAPVIDSCHDYFERLWTLAAGHSLTAAMLKKWESVIGPLAAKMSSKSAGLRDYGADLGFMPDSPSPTVEPTVTTQAFVKFFGTGNSRSERSLPVIDEVEGSESHWALAYPNTKRPRQVGTGDIMFIARMVHSPNDMLIYGRAIAYQHQDGRDAASDADIARRDWKETWGTYIRVRDPEFIAGTLVNGISLGEMMDELGAESFLSTSKNQKCGNPDANTAPRIALRSKAQMPLTQIAADWLNTRFYQALAKHGRIPSSELEKLYWPPLPAE
jgi:hypothetical protein